MRDIKNLLKSWFGTKARNTTKGEAQLKSSRESGAYSEEIASSYLRKGGYALLERNYTTPLGEIDIIAKKDKTIIFFEVKSSYTNKFDPLERIDRKKQERIRRVASWYMSRNFRNKEWPRTDFGAISVIFDAENNPQVELLVGVFCAID
ncbi:MAG: YraN family protein [Pseudomonadota bacterium]